MQDRHDVFSGEPQIPGLPAKMHYSSPQQPGYSPRIPQPGVGGLSAVERSHVQSEQRTAQDQDQQLYQVNHQICWSQRTPLILQVGWYVTGPSSLRAHYMKYVQAALVWHLPPLECLMIDAACLLRIGGMGSRRDVHEGWRF